MLAGGSNCLYSAVSSLSLCTGTLEWLKRVNFDLLSPSVPHWNGISKKHSEIYMAKTFTLILCNEPLLCLNWLCTYNVILDAYKILCLHTFIFIFLVQISHQTYPKFPIKEQTRHLLHRTALPALRQRERFSIVLTFPVLCNLMHYRWAYYK